MSGVPERRPRKVLTAEQKHLLWVRMLIGQITQADAAAEAGVDRSVISRLRAVARDGAIAALGASRPGRPRQSRAEAMEAAALRAEAGAAGPHGGLPGRGAGGAAGKVGLGTGGPVPAGVDGAAEAVLLDLIDGAVAAGWTRRRVCSVLGLGRRRAWRWARRRDDGRLDDARPGGRPIHGLLDWERDEIVKLFDEWGEVDRSHRKLARRGSCLGRVWVSPSTVDRPLAGHGLALAGLPRPKRAARTPWPQWCEWRPNQLWCWDGTQFPRCPTAKHAYAIVDAASRKWIATHLTPSPDSVAARVLFARALDGEGLPGDDLAARLADPDAEPPDDDIALLLAISDNGPEMRAGDTAAFMALCSTAQRFGRPSTPTDHPWIESMFGHAEHDHPHLETPADPADLSREPERTRTHYNGVRLHEGIGHVTPDDEHQGRGEHIRQARRDGLRQADAQRRHAHRDRPPPRPTRHHRQHTDAA